METDGVQHRDGARGTEFVSLNANEALFRQEVAVCLAEIRHRALITEEVHKMLCGMFQASGLIPSTSSEPPTTKQEKTK